MSSFINYDFDLRNEHFWLFVPDGYTGQEPWGLIVFINGDWVMNKLPEGWDKVLAANKLLFIAPQSADNGKPNNRREGLGTVAALEMIKNYKIDRDRVYIAGFSGGARMASQLGFHQSDVFRATIQSCGSNYPKEVPRVAVVDADFKGHPEKYGLMQVGGGDETAARKKVKFVLATGPGDFRNHFIHDIYNGGFKHDGYQALLLDVPGTGHQPCRADTLQKALDFIEHGTSAP